MNLYWAVVTSRGKEEKHRSFFATIESSQWKACLKIYNYFQEKFWLRKEEILEIKCEPVGELTPDNFGSIKLIP